MNKGVPEPQAALDKIKIIENNDRLVDLRGIQNLTFKEDGDFPLIPFLRAPVAKMLEQAASKLAPEFHLNVRSALRDFEHQKKIWQSHYDRHKAEHPEWQDHTIRKMVNKYAAPIDHPAPPGHCTGAAVDVVLQREDGSFVDLVPPDLTDWSLGHTWTTKIPDEQRKLRMLLVETMLSVGFSNCRDEYWHYSWGDSGWAVREGLSECHYGVVTIPEL